MKRGGFYLSGKDYFTQLEAAHYCGVSPSQFRAQAARYGLKAFKFMGKLQYRRSDIQAVMERAATGPSALDDLSQIQSMSQLDRRRRPS